MSYPAYIRPGIVPASEWAPLPKLRPVASYDPQRKLAAVANAYPVKEVLRAGGYRWHEPTKTWQRTNLSIEEFRADWELFQNIGINLDAPTAALLANLSNKPAEAPSAKPAAVKAEPAPTSSKPAFDASSLTRARERIMRLAASGRITDKQDLAELRAIAGLLRQATDVA